MNGKNCGFRDLSGLIGQVFFLAELRQRVARVSEACGLLGMAAYCYNSVIRVGSEAR